MSLDDILDEGAEEVQDLFGTDSADTEDGSGSPEDSSPPDQESDEMDACRLMHDVAAEKVVENCSQEAIEQRIASMLGTDLSDVDCDDLLQVEADNHDEVDFASSWVACRASQLVNNGTNIPTALETAWDEVNGVEDQGW